MNAALATATATTTATAVVVVVPAGVSAYRTNDHGNRIAPMSHSPRFSKRSARWHRKDPM